MLGTGVEGGGRCLGRRLREGADAWEGVEGGGRCLGEGLREGVDAWERG